MVHIWAEDCYHKIWGIQELQKLKDNCIAIPELPLKWKICLVHLKLQNKWIPRTSLVWWCISWKWLLLDQQLPSSIHARRIGGKFPLTIWGWWQIFMDYFYLLWAMSHLGKILRKNVWCHWAIFYFLARMLAITLFKKAGRVCAITFWSLAVAVPAYFKATRC